MRIAGINSSNYHLNQPNKPQKTSSQGQSSASDPSSLPQSAATGAISKDSTQTNANIVSTKGFSTEASQPKVSQQNGVLMQPTARNDTQGFRGTGASDERVRFYSQQQALQTGTWQAYTSDAQSTTSTKSPTPDNTNHKAKAAISEYLQTQYIEERLHFEAVLGIDDYA
jgi:hypothetical protein